ncbi:MAG TPA: hypothetical protein VLT61_13645 [Anaeromyxobacteraceae bacterium]|nr:hypothetical protein [Anaeromyxobacteraceae bacterium]
MTDAPPEELKHLPAFHYALAVLTASATALSALPIAAGWQALGRSALFAEAHAEAGLASPSFGGWIFLIGGALAVAAGGALAAGLFVAGRSIARRRRHTLCVAVAMAATFFFPLGTLLGFHTINCLSTPRALRAFGLEPRRR